jgi:hypothetical protein
MATVKTATLTFRIDPALKEALRAAADQEHRSIANMVEVLIRGYCERHSISIPLSEEIKNNKGARS